MAGRRRLVLRAGTRLPGTTVPTQPAGADAMHAAKNVECLRLAETIPLPSVRGTGLSWITRKSSSGIWDRSPEPPPMPRWSPASAACWPKLMRPCGFRNVLWSRSCRRCWAGIRGCTSVTSRRRSRLAPAIRYGWSTRCGWRRRSDECCALGEWDVPGLRIRHTRAMRRGVPAPSGCPRRIPDNALRCSRSRRMSHWSDGGRDGELTATEDPIDPDRVSRPLSSTPGFDIHLLSIRPARHDGSTPTHSAAPARNCRRRCRPPGRAWQPARRQVR